MKRITTNNPASVLAQILTPEADRAGLEVDEAAVEQWAGFCADGCTTEDQAQAIQRKNFLGREN